MNEELKRQFTDAWGSKPLLVRSPGRINIIGEHTDYNGGFVLPAAIQKDVWVATSRRTDMRILLYSVQFEEFRSFSLEAVHPVQNSWTNYVLGIVDQLLQQERPIAGFNMMIDGQVPVGAGMSSSAALECAVVYALDQLFDLDMPRLEMTKIAQRAEKAFAGVNCGIMDPYTSLFGKKDFAIKLDCRSCTHEYVPLDLEGWRIVLMDTGVKHTLAASAYNRRRQECAEGLSHIQKQLPKIKDLGEVTLPMIEWYIDDELLKKRCAYVVKENARVLAACEDLKVKDVRNFGKLLFASHEGLRHDYEVSCPELDWLVDAVKGREDVAGARMMGGGFGGCTINLVREDAVEEVIASVSEGYEKYTRKKAMAWVAESADGTEGYKPGK